ncbi:MAG: TonB-dependent receptor plug domain-containing protein, partial [Opitutaceae bacterium]
MFLAGDVASVRTKALKGDFTPREAIERLLEGTPLTAVQTPNGSIAIKGTAIPNGVRAAQTANDRPVANPRIEAAPGSTALPPGEKDAIVLSPFEVTSDKDTGFAAAGSLAGGRLAGELRDTPVAYSVMTREFIDALGITDLLEASEWSTGNTERLHVGGRDFFGNTGEYSTRGFISTAQANNGGNRQRNFFPMFSFGESYNLERYDFGRGPNSILFGNGSLGGVSSSTTKRAKTDRDFQTIKMSFGSWQKFRSELDVNQPLLDKKAAVRVALLWQDSEGWRMNEFDNRRGAFLATTFKPFKNTEIRLEGEYYRHARLSGRTDINDRFSGWDGVTVYNSPAPLATLPANANALGISRNGANHYVFDPFGPANAIMHYRNDPITRGGGETATTPIAGFTQVGGSFNTNAATLVHAQNVPAGRFDTAIANSFFRPFSEEFTTVPDGPEQIQYFRDVQLTVTQRVGDHLFFEIAADVNTSDLFINGGNSALQNIRIDINRVLPNGAPNPNFLQPYSEADLQRNRFAHNNRNFRGAAAYVMPANRFGKFTFNVLGGINHRERNQDYRFLTLNEGSDHRQWGHPAQQAVTIRRYWNAPSRPTPGGWGQSGRDLAEAPVNFIDPITGVSKQIQPRWTIDNQRADTQQLDSSDFNYALASLNARFFKDRLVVLGAVRYDTYKFAADFQKDRGDYPLDWDGTHRIMRPEAPADYLALTYQPRNAAGVPNAPVQTAITRPRIAATGDRDPLYLNDRFQGDFNPPDITGSQITRSVGTVLHLFSWFNPSFNYAETFNPPVGTPRINGQLKEPTVAKGTDYGLRMELFKRRLDLNFTYYEAEEINATDGFQPNFLNRLINANAVGDQS